MATTSRKVERRQQILQALALMLEENPGERITTAKLAVSVGVSEAALYRHFPSKSKMFEGLIEFCEESVFSRVKLICSEPHSALEQVQRIVWLLLSFAEKNPGICRILNGDALTGETQRLRKRVAQFYSRLETQIRQILREAELREGYRPPITVNASANLLLAYTQGKIAQYVGSEFESTPTSDLEDQWQLLVAGLKTKVAEPA